MTTLGRALAIDHPSRVLPRGEAHEQVRAAAVTELGEEVVDDLIQGGKSMATDEALAEAERWLRVAGSA